MINPSRHHSLQTAKLDVHRAITSVLQATRIGGEFRKPRELVQAEVATFVTLLVVA